jgi:hypothetical protein
MQGVTPAPASASPADHTPVVRARNATRPREKGFNALKLSLSQPELIRHRQALLPRSNTMSHLMKFEFAKVCYAKTWARNGIVFNPGEFALTAGQPRSR